ncbi:MAG: hypothetical protein M0022_06605 [Desulfobacteraceae bacterium]|nr:hypothetical protein [Desulfobacteraceae bacterium]
MELKDYCKNVDVELTGWRAKLYNIMRQIDNLPTGEKQRMYEKVNSLHIILTELDDRLDKLRISCPTEWSPDREKIQGRLTELWSQYGEAEKALFDYGRG